MKFPRGSSHARAAVWALLLAVASTGSVGAQNLADFESRVTVRTLPNGWTFVVCERDVAPVFSFATHVNVGSVNEVPGITGIAHMFEHMAFKGTPRIGTRNYEAEMKAMEEVDRAYAAFDAERRKPSPDPETVSAREAAWQKAQERASELVVDNEFEDLIEREGGVGVNAGTGADATVYSYSLPSNKLELWAYLESERFLHPVLRDFYKEREVVKEERRLRVESQSFGRLLEQFQNTAFSAHPFRHSTGGYMSDLDSFTRDDARTFYETYYVPSNMVTAIVGDVKAAEIFPLVEKYFGRIPAGEPPPPVRTVEPPQRAEKVIRMPDPSQPVYLEGYHRGAVTSEDDAVYDAIADVLSNGRTSRLYRSLVRDRQSAVAVQTLAAYPGDKYPTLFLVFGVPAPGHTNQEVRDAIRTEIERLRNEDVTPTELAMVKTRAKASLIGSLNSNLGLANNLADFHAIFGDWRELFRSVEHIEKVTAADIRRVASQTFLDTNRTVAMLETAPPPAVGGDSGR